jgi:hypothetical protein
MTRLLDLLSQLDRLRAQHRAGIVPPMGELESLFDAAADVRGEIATGTVRASLSAAAADLDVVPRATALTIEYSTPDGPVTARARIPLQLAVPAGTGA